MENIENANVLAIFDIFCFQLLFHIPELCSFTNKRIMG